MYPFLPTAACFVGLFLLTPLLAQEPPTNGHDVLMALASADATGVVDQAMFLDARNSRLDMKNISYRWTQTEGPPAEIKDKDKPRAVFIPNQEGEYRFRLDLSAEKAQSDDTVTIRVIRPASVLNGDFSAPGNGIIPPYWEVERTWDGVIHAIDPTGGIAKSPALRIRIDDQVKTEGKREENLRFRLRQKLQLEPFRIYRLTGKVRGEKVKQGSYNFKSPSLVGPSLGTNTWLGDSFRNTKLNEQLKGNFDWTPISFEFPTTDNGQIEIFLQAAFCIPGKQAPSGTVWFDDIRVEPDDSYVTLHGRNCVRFFRKVAMAKLKPGQAQEYLDELDSYIDIMSDLTGMGLPNKQVFFHPVSWGIWEGAWSGNPSLQSNEPIEEWVKGRLYLKGAGAFWGELHELGHNLGMAPPLWGSETAPAVLVWYAMVEMQRKRSEKINQPFLDRLDAELKVSTKEFNEYWFLSKYLQMSKKAGYSPCWNAFKQVFRMTVVLTDPTNPRAKLWKQDIDFPSAEFNDRLKTAITSKNKWLQFEAIINSASRLAKCDLWSVFSREEKERLEKFLSHN